MGTFARTHFLKNLVDTARVIFIPFYEILILSLFSILNETSYLVSPFL